MQFSKATADAAETVVNLLDIGMIKIDVPKEPDANIIAVFGNEEIEPFRINQIIRSLHLLIDRASETNLAGALHFCHGIFPDKNPSFTLLGLMVIYVYTRLPPGIRASDLLRLMGDC